MDGLPFFQTRISATRGCCIAHPWIKIVVAVVITVDRNNHYYWSVKSQFAVVVLCLAMKFFYSKFLFEKSCIFKITACFHHRGRYFQYRGYHFENDDCYVAIFLKLRQYNMAINRAIVNNSRCVMVMPLFSSMSSTLI